MTRVISNVRLCPCVRYYASDVTRIALHLNTPVSDTSSVMKYKHVVNKSPCFLLFELYHACQFVSPEFHRGII
jgi:hypothetical protein